MFDEVKGKNSQRLSYFKKLISDTDLQINQSTDDTTELEELKQELLDECKRITTNEDGISYYTLARNKIVQRAVEIVQNELNDTKLGKLVVLLPKQEIEATIYYNVNVYYRYGSYNRKMPNISSIDKKYRNKTLTTLFNAGMRDLIHAVISESRYASGCHGGNEKSCLLTDDTYKDILTLFNDFVIKCYITDVLRYIRLFDKNTRDIDSDILKSGLVGNHYNFMYQGTKCGGTVIEEPFSNPRLEYWYLRVKLDNIDDIKVLKDYDMIDSVKIKLL